MKQNTKPFIHGDFLLDNDFSQSLYHTYAKDLPIIDYHCHLPPKEIAQDHSFQNLTQIWINGDHYKWRAMRTMGIAEDYITGEAADAEKFGKWAQTVPHTLRNPLYHWTHLELKRYFGIDVLLGPDTAKEIYEEASQKLATPEFSCQNLIKGKNVEVVCTTEDPTDTLEYHGAIKDKGFGVKITTAFRPDKAILITNETYNAYVDRLAQVSGLDINTFRDLCDALLKRLDFFAEMGCTLSDHGLTHLPYRPYNKAEIEAIFQKRRNQKLISPEEAEKFQTALLVFLCQQYHARGWVQQFHLGAQRNNNARMNEQLGPDTGWDSIGDYPQAETLAAFLNRLDEQDMLAKTILYNLNPADNAVFATMIGNFNDGRIKGKMQFGSGWWFLDQKEGMTQQMNALSNMGLLSCFVGMLTDSRSFMSYPRHEYFRRVLCQLLGKEMQSGELPNDMELVGQMVRNICYHNAKEYFDF